MLRGTDQGLSLRRAFRPFARRFAYVGAGFVFLFVAGALGYVVLEGWTFFDGLYMAVTVTTSLGIMEVHPLSTAGRAFTMILLIVGITGLGFWWGLITALIVELDLLDIFRRRRMLRRIESIEGHFIVCGAGRIGRVVAREMTETKTPFVIVERDPAKLEALRDELPELVYMLGDATKSHCLQAVRIEHALGLAACLGEDADNLLVCLTARGLKRELRIVSRAYDEESLDKMRRAGADHAISPNVSGGLRMASVLLRPHASSLDTAVRIPGLSLRLEEATVPPESPLVGQRLAEARIPQRTGLVVVALRRATATSPSELVHNPGPETSVAAGDVMIVVGEEAQIIRLREYLATG